MFYDRQIMFENLGGHDKVVLFQQLCGLKLKQQQQNGVVTTFSVDSISTHKNGFVKHQETTATASITKRVHSATKNSTSNHASEYEYNSWFHALFHLSSSLGDEQVLIALLSFIFWNFDPEAVISVYLCLAVSLYLGQGAKDVFKVERPESPPVIRVERKYAEEYSLPSTHAMMGMVVPFSLVYFTYEKFQYDLVSALTIATVCCILVAASRVYLGMHSVKDVIMGLLFESAILAVTFPCVKNFGFTDWCQTSPNAVSTAIIFPLMLLWIYPTSTPTSYNTFSDTALVLGIISGSMIGLRYFTANKLLMVAFVAKIQTMSSYQAFGLYMLRFATGTTLLAITRVVMKWFITSTIPKLLPASIILKPLGYKRFVEIPHKFITYGMVAFNCVFLAPKVFKLGGI